MFITLRMIHTDGYNDIFKHSRLCIDDIAEYNPSEHNKANTYLRMRDNDEAYLVEETCEEIDRKIATLGYAVIDSRNDIVRPITHTYHEPKIRVIPREELEDKLEINKGNTWKDWVKKLFS